MATVGGMVMYMTLNAMGVRTEFARLKAEMATWNGQMAATGAAGSGAAAQQAATKGFPMLAHSATFAGLAMAAFGAMSIKAATDFQWSMKLIETQVGAGLDEVDAMKKGILDNASALQQTPEALSRGMFHIQAVGLRGKDALKAMEAAAKGAAIGNAELETTTQALVAVITTGIGGTEDFSTAMGIMNGIAGTGNIRLQQLAKSFSTGVLATAKQFGLDLYDVGAALATMSDQGIPAQEGATRLRITIAQLAAPTQIAVRALSRIGLEQRDLADAMRSDEGLLGALKLLRKSLDESGLDAVEQSQVLRDAFGGSRSSAGIMTLVNSIDLMGNKLDDIHEKSGSFQEDFALASQTAHAKFAALQAALEVAAVRFGNLLLPIVTAVVDGLTLVAQHVELLLVPLGYLAVMMTTRLFTAVMSWTTGLQTAAMRMATNGLGASQMGTRILATVAPTQAATVALNQLGLAAAAANGQVTAFQRANGTWQARIGNRFGPTMTPAQAAAINAGNAAMNGTTVAANAAAGATGLFTRGLLALKGAAGLAAVGVSTLLGPIGLLYAGLTIIGANVENVRQGFTVLGVAVIGLIRDIVKAIADLPVVGEAFKGILDGLNQAYEDGMQSIMRQGQEMNAAAANAGNESLIHYSMGMDQNGDMIPETLIDLWGTTMAGVEQAAQDSGAAAMREYAKGVASERDTIRSSYTTLVDSLKNPLTQQQEIAQLWGIRTSQALADGLASGDRTVRANAIALAKSIDEQLINLTGGAEGSYAASMGDTMKRITDAANGNFKPDWSAADITQADAIAKKWAVLGHTVKGAGDVMEEARQRMIAFGISKEEGLTQINAELDANGTVGTEATQTAINNTKQLAAAWEAMKPSAAAASTAFQGFVNSLKDGTADALLSTQEQVALFFQTWQGSLDNLRALAANSGTELTVAIADGLKSGWNNVDSAMGELMTLMQNQWDSNRRVSFLLAQLNSAEIAAGLASSDPLVLAQTNATIKIITGQLDALTGGAYSAGQNTAVAFNTAFNEAMKNGADVTSAAQAGNAAAFAAKNNWDLWLGNIDVSQGQRDQLQWLEDWRKKAAGATTGLRDMAGDANAALTSAFDNIKAKAMDYFDRVHEKNLRAIADARDHKNALLDAKLAREERPITRAERALRFRQQEQQEAQLRDAVARATDPRAKQEAIWALQNFLDQRHIDEMRDEFDQNREIIEKRKERNNEIYNDQVKAENKRYQNQKENFSRELEQAERFLKRHPEMWASAQGKILSILKKYGVEYTNVGDLMGKNFSTSINRHLDNVIKNLRKLWQATHPEGAGKGTGGATGFPGSSLGDKGAVGGIMGMLGGGIDPKTGRGHLSVGALDFELRQKKNGNLVVYVGDQKLAEITDRQLYGQETIYQSGGTKSGTGSSHR